MNLYAVRHQNLNLACLPIPPYPHIELYIFSFLSCIQLLKGKSKNSTLIMQPPSTATNLHIPVFLLIKPLYSALRKEKPVVCFGMSPLLQMAWKQKLRDSFYNIPPTGQSGAKFADKTLQSTPHLLKNTNSLPWHCFHEQSGCEYTDNVSASNSRLSSQVQQYQHTSAPYLEDIQ